LIYEKIYKDLIPIVLSRKLIKSSVEKKFFSKGDALSLPLAQPLVEKGQSAGCAYANQ